MDSVEEEERGGGARRAPPQRRRQNTKAERARDWCFTLNNYRVAPVGYWPEMGKTVPELYFELGEWRDSIVYFVCQQEVCPTTRTPHLQGFVQFKNARSLLGVTGLCGLEGSHVEPRRGNPEEASNYCKDEETRDPQGIGPFEFGTLAGTRAGQGRRTDWDSVHDLARRRASVVEFLEEVPHLAYPHIGRIPTWVAAHDSEVRDWKTRPIILFGPPRAGKSFTMRRWAKEQAALLRSSVFEKSDADKWWDGYNGEYVVTIDEMGGNYFKWTDLLKFFEEGVLRVQYKGGSRHMLAKVVYMTCNVHPAYWYKDRAWDDTNAFRARIAEFGELWHFQGSVRGPDGAMQFAEPVRDLELIQPPSEVKTLFDDNVRLHGPVN